MQNPLRTSHAVRLSFLLTSALSLGAVTSASAGNTYWLGGSTTNWSAASSWSGAKQTYYNQVDFNNTGANPNTSTAINNWLDSTSGGAGQMPIWQLDYVSTNMNHTTLISPGVTLTTGAGNGKLYVGCDQNTAGGVANATETITILGTGGATLNVGGNLRVGQGCAATGDSLHNVTLDLSGLDNFIMPNVSGSRFLVTGQSSARAQGTVYLAKTNSIVLGNDFEIGAMGNYSNTVPVGVYLGLTNTIFPGSGSDNLTVGSRGCTNGFLKFNPAFLGGANPPASCSIGSLANGGRVNNFYIGYANNGLIPAAGYCDFSGGYVNAMVSTMYVGSGGNGLGTNGTGVLTYNSGLMDVNNLYVGYQAASAGGVGIGTVNLGANATLKVNNTLVLGGFTGTATAGNAGTLNLNGGTLLANVITNMAGVATLNLTNATWQVAVTPGSMTNASANVTSLNLGGSANTLAVTFASPLTRLPSTNRLVKYTTFSGIDLANISLVLPVNGSTPYQGYLLNNTAAGVIDLIITNGVVPPNLAWSGASSGDWDLSSPNWWDGTHNTAFAQADNALFDDTASGSTTINLATQLKPATLVINNTTKTYTFTGSGSLAGDASLGGAIVGGLNKQGSGTLILAHTGADTYLGGVNIYGGVLQVGDGSTSGGGSLGLASGAVNNSAALVFNRPDTLTVGNVISGAGSLTNLGGTLVLSGANTFTGPLAINAGTVQLGNNAALGGTAGTAFVKSGATLDLNGSNPGGKPMVVQGSGNGNGALINNSTAGTPQLTAVTLAGDTTFGGSARWDLRGTLSSGGHAYNITAAYGSGSYSAEWRDLAGDPALGNIDIVSGTLGWAGSTTMGTSGTLTIEGGAAIKFYNTSANVNLTKPMVLNDSSTVFNAGGANTISAPITLNGYNSFDISGPSLTLSGPLSGTGTLYKLNGTSPLLITGASPTFGGTVLAYAGKVRLDGTLGNGASTITTMFGTQLAGSGVNNGPVDVSGGFTPGDAGTVGTFTCGALTLEGNAMLTNNLAASASGASSRVVVNGNLTLNNGTIYVNPVGGTLEGNRPYTLITYTGNLNGALPAVQTPSASVYTIVLSNATSLNPKQIQAIVTGGQSDVLVWDNAAGTATWDVQASPNWSNTTTHASSDVFYSADAVVLNDSITNSLNPATTITISVPVGPSVVTNNSTVNYTLTGSGWISDGSRIVKLGSSTLTISNANDFTGPVSIYGGTVVAASATALGGVSGTVTITNGGTLDAGFALGAKPVVVAGAGVGGKGALVNNSGAPIYDSNGGVANTVTLTGDTTFGGTNRWDLGSPSGATLSTGGKPYNLTLIGAPGSYRGEWQNLTIDPKLANIDLVSGEQGLKQMQSLGDPAGTVTIYSNAQLTFWGGSNYTKNYYVKNGGTLLVRYDGPVFNFNLTLEGGATFSSVNNAKTFTGPVTLLGLAHLQSGNNLNTFSNTISGPGGFYWDNYDNQLAFAAANTYTGPTYIGNNLALALVGNGSILNSAFIFFGGSDTNGLRLDVSGKADHTLTLASGQTLAGIGRINGALALAAGATLSPGTNTLPTPTLGAIGADGAITLNGTTTMKIYNPGMNDVVQSATSISYGGTLNLAFLPNSLAAGNTWKLFKAPAGGYSGSFTLTPSSPGNGLAWDTSRLAIDGTLGVVSSAAPSIATITVANGQVSLSGTNGPASGSYVVLTTTNVAQPVNLWQALTTNAFDASGNFNWKTNLNSGEPTRFYRLRLQ
jgi:fibronectin-binding autotransporter adhesin